MNPTIEEFLNDPNLRNSWCRFNFEKKKISTYLRKSHSVWYTGGQKPQLQRANTKLMVRPRHKDAALVGQPLDALPMYNSGAYRALDQYMTKIAAEYGFASLLVENVLNDGLIPVLLRYGYVRSDALDPPNFVKRLDRLQTIASGVPKA